KSACRSMGEGATSVNCENRRRAPGLITVPGPHAVSARDQRRGRMLAPPMPETTWAGPPSTAGLVVDRPISVPLRPAGRFTTAVPAGGWGLSWCPIPTLPLDPDFVTWVPTSTLCVGCVVPRLCAPKLVGVVTPMAFLGTSPAVPGFAGCASGLAVGR